VLSVSPDAITHDKPRDNSGSNDTGGAENATSEPKSQELVYSARVSLDHQQMQVDDRLVNVSPGMALTIENRDRHAPNNQLSVSPLARYLHGSLRER
jgi:hemolysin D